MKLVCRDDDDRNIWPDEETRTFVENGLVLLGTDSSDPRNIRRSEELFGKAEEEEVPPNPRIFINKYGRKNWERDNRFSRDLSAEQFINLYSAVAFANANGRILDVRVSITWELLGLARHRPYQDAIMAFTNEFIKPLRLWLDYKGKKEVYRKSPYELRYIYVHEVGRKHGFHTHLLIDIPKHLRKDFRQWMKNRLTELSLLDGDIPEGTFNITCPPSYPINRQWIAFSYMCKGLDKRARIFSKIGEYPYIKAIDLIQFNYENPGDILCKKKCGVSHNINEKARKKHNYKSWLEMGLTDVRILYSGIEYLYWARKQKWTVLLNKNEEARLVKDEKIVREICVEERTYKWCFVTMRQLNEKILQGNSSAIEALKCERTRL